MVAHSSLKDPTKPQNYKDLSGLSSDKLKPSFLVCSQILYQCRILQSLSRLLQQSLEKPLILPIFIREHGTAPRCPKSRKCQGEPNDAGCPDLHLWDLILRPLLNYEVHVRYCSSQAAPTLLRDKCDSVGSIHPQPLKAPSTQLCCDLLLYPTHRPVVLLRAALRTFRGFWFGGHGVFRSASLVSWDPGPTWVSLGKCSLLCQQRDENTHACSLSLCITCTVPQLPPEDKTGVWASTLLGPSVGERGSS